MRWPRVLHAIAMVFLLGELIVGGGALSATGQSGINFLPDWIGVVLILIASTALARSSHHLAPRPPMLYTAAAITAVCPFVIEEAYRVQALGPLVALFRFIAVWWLMCALFTQMKRASIATNFPEGVTSAATAMKGISYSLGITYAAMHMSLPTAIIQPVVVLLLLIPLILASRALWIGWRGLSLE